MKNIKIEIKWAIIFSLATLAWMLLEKSLGWHDKKIADHATLSLFFSIPAILVYVFALLDKKKNFYSGRMSFKQGFVSGLIITGIVVVLSPFTQIIISEVITPEYFNNVIAYSVSSGQMTQEEAEGMFNLKSYILQSLIGALIMGILTSAIVAFFVRTKS